MVQNRHLLLLQAFLSQHVVLQALHVTHAQKKISHVAEAVNELLAATYEAKPLRQVEQSLPVKQCSLQCYFWFLALHFSVLFACLSTASVLSCAVPCCAVLVD